MSLEQAQQAYAALAPERQARFLAMLAHHITVWARDSYPPLLHDTTLVVERLRAVNELQHRVTAHIAHLLCDNELRYPDDVFVAILFDFARDAACESSLSKTFEQLYEAYVRNGSDGTPANATRQASIPS